MVIWMDPACRISQSPSRVSILRLETQLYPHYSSMPPANPTLFPRLLSPSSDLPCFKCLLSSWALGHSAECACLVPSSPTLLLPKNIFHCPLQSFTWHSPLYSPLKTETLFLMSILLLILNTMLRQPVVQMHLAKFIM